MWDPTLMLASRVTGLLAPNPWQKPSAIFDRVYVYSDFSARMLADSGYERSKVVVTGIPLLDRVHNTDDPAASRAAIHAALGLAEAEDFILFNVEPAAEHSYANWADHRARFRGLMTMLKRVGRPVVLSLHPLCHIEEYQYVEAEFGFVIARDHKIFDLYPYCRFALSFPCSTNVVAAEFGKLLVIYDFYGMAAKDAPRQDLFRLDGAWIGHDITAVERLVMEAVATTPARTLPQLSLDVAACPKILADVETAFPHRFGPATGARM
jgi:hypothetical protein